jgi:hypothetical protein
MFSRFFNLDQPFQRKLFEVTGSSKNAMNQQLEEQPTNTQQPENSPPTRQPNKEDENVSIRVVNTGMIRTIFLLSKSTLFQIIVHLIVGFRQLCTFTLLLPLGTLFVCFVTSYVFQAEEVHETHCRVSTRDCK